MCPTCARTYTPQGIGLPLEEALRFWRAEFAPRVPGDKFDKEYAYNVRHSYGKEGKKANYTPWGCLKIVQMTPNQVCCGARGWWTVLCSFMQHTLLDAPTLHNHQGEYHGCPYKTWTGAALRSTLQGMQVPAANVEAAVSKASAGHFQLACAAVWEGKHSCACTAGITHPNQYYDESRRVLTTEQKEATTA